MKTLTEAKLEANREVGRVLSEALPAALGIIGRQAARVIGRGAAKAARSGVRREIPGPNSRAVTTTNSNRSVGSARRPFQREEPADAEYRIKERPKLGQPQKDTTSSTQDRPRRSLNFSKGIKRAADVINTLRKVNKVRKQSIGKTAQGLHKYYNDKDKEGNEEQDNG